MSPLGGSARKPKSVYRARTIKRARRTKAQIGQLEEQMLDVLREDQPQSVRHMFYRMTNPRLEPVEKSEAGYRHVQDRLVKMRRSGAVPYGWITDATRRGYFTNTFNGTADFLRRMTGLYRADLWQHADYYCEVWVESRSIAGVIQDLCEELAVSLYPSGGFTSLTLAFEAAEAINEVHDGRDVVIFYIGDYDPAGVLIDVAIERELRQHLDRDVKLTFERIGITEQQVVDFDLPTKPRKAGERRARHILNTVEAEAMPAGLMRQLLRDRIEALLPPRALQVSKAAEASEREFLESLAEAVGRTWR
jgi:hypothetical protein